jgi:uncharacterized protein YecT (DUF1311 family)
MKELGFAACILFAFLLVAAASVAQSDPCARQDYSNVEMKDCYSKENPKVNAQIDSLVARITADFRRDAKQYGGNGDYVIAQCLLKAASKVERSQASWRKYREAHCSAIDDSYTTGTGHWIAHEECELRLGKERLKELRTSFLPGR